MQVPCDEGVAIHIGPESCAVAREGLGEALTGVRVGQPLSRESFLFWVPTARESVLNRERAEKDAIVAGSRPAATPNAKHNRLSLSAG